MKLSQMKSSSSILIDLKDITKTFGTGELEQSVLSDLSLTIRDGETVAITGQSGSGKSTLLSILGLLESPSSGEYKLRGFPINNISYTQLAEIRNKHLGWVFQNFSLINSLTALQNVALPLRFNASISSSEYESLSKEALAKVGLEQKRDLYPEQLSGGQQQRIAIARALVSKPAVILADEPTGNLDKENSDNVIELLLSQANSGTTLILVTHNVDYAKLCNKVYTIRNGVLSNVEQ